MHSKTRWVVYEVLKLAVLVAIFSYLHSYIIDAKYEAYASTDRLLSHQTNQEDRLINLEHIGTYSGESIAATRDAVHKVSEDLDAQRQRFASERTTLSQLIEDRSVELRSLVQAGIQRMEDSSQTVSDQFIQRVSTLEVQVERSPKRMKERMMYPIVQMRGNSTVGSGVVIFSRSLEEGGKALTYVLTAFHVVQEITEGLEDPTLVSDLKFVDRETDELSSKSYEARVVAFHADADIAMLRLELDTPWPYVAEFASPEETAKLDMFDQVYAVGCPLGNKPMPTVGEISSQKKIVAGENFWMVNAPTFFGNSGGGVFQGSNGRLIGISSMIYTYGKSQPLVVPHMGLFVPLDSVRNWLSKEGYSHLCELGADPDGIIQKASARDALNEKK